MKIIKTLCWILGGTAVALAVFYIFTASRTEFSFGNEGKIICVVRKSWGIFSNGDITCFNIKKIGEEQNIIKYKCSELNGEIIISK